jgi:Na+-transporting NADH:ubiquinone oxidoreductase subunit A
MPRVISLKRGLDIPLKEVPPKIVVQAPEPTVISLTPTGFRGLTPRLSVKEGDTVAAGDPIFFDKARPNILFTAPVGGTVCAIVRGEKRKLLEVRVDCTHQPEPRTFSVGAPDSKMSVSTMSNSVTSDSTTSIPMMPNSLTSNTQTFNSKTDNALLFYTLTRNQIVETLLQSGCWPYLVQRPYGTIANPTDTPKAIFISAFDTAPLAPDLDFVITGQEDDLQRGIDILSHLSPNGIIWSIPSHTPEDSALRKVQNVHIYEFKGKHPAGNVGIQIHHIAPISKGEVAWTIDPQAVIIIGRLFGTGVLNTRKMVALTGPSCTKPCYVSILPGTPLSALPHVGALRPNVRYISGNCLTGKDVGYNGALGFYHHQITLLPEGTHSELLGWAKIFRPKTFSISRTYLSWLTPKKRYRLDTNTHGGERAFVMSNLYRKVLPMDIYPDYLLKAILSEDIDKMEALGIYEVIEEDFALCEFICPSKVNIQEIVSKGIDLMIKEMS